MFATIAQAKRLKAILKAWGFVGYPIVSGTYDPENGNQEIDVDALAPETVGQYNVLVNGELKPVAGAVAALDSPGAPSYRLALMFETIGLGHNNLGGPAEVQKAYSAYEAAIGRNLK